MKISIFENQHFIQSLWAGGSTTQLYISPADSIYTERNFDVRISTAKVEVEKSVFTSLPGVNRKLMILDGEITISHLNHYTKLLKKHNVDSFCGDWETSSIGTCTDFNVMTRGNIHSELYTLNVSPSRKVQLEVEKQLRTLGFYVVSGSFYFEADQSNFFVLKDNLLVINDIDVPNLTINSNEDSLIVVTEIY